MTQALTIETHKRITNQEEKPEIEYKTTGEV
jgi:hypothetical protein